MASLDKAYLFTTEVFDYTSQLPDEYNAGNRFYGRDVAAYLCARLDGKGLPADYLDEDWGWLAMGAVAPAINFEIAIYNVNAHSEGGRPGAPAWGLWIRAFERTKLLGLLPRKTQVPVPPALDTALLDAIRELGTMPQVWTDGPGG